MRVAVDNEWFRDLMAPMLAVSEHRPVAVSRLRHATGFERQPIVHFPFVTVLLDGVAVIPVTADGRLREVRPGEGIYYPPGSMVSIEPVPTHRLFRVSLMKDQTYFAVDDRIVTADGSNRYKQIHLYACPTVAGSRLMQLTSELESVAGAMRERKESLLFELILAELFELIRHPSNAGKAEHTWALLQAFLREHYRQPINRHDAAAELGISTGHISLLFRRFGNGRTFLSELRGLRMVEAKRLLSQTELPTSEIAHRCGYSSSSYFSRDFRKLVGCPPVEWRNAKSG